MTRKFRLAAVTPPVLLDPAIAIAASRAGFTGVLDLEYTRDEGRAKEAICGLGELGGEPCGIKLSADDEAFASSILASLPAKISLIILTGGSPGYLSREIRKKRRDTLHFLVEATSAAEGRAAEQAGADGVIAKGHEAGGNVGEETTFVLLQRLLAELGCPIWAHGGIGLHTAAACYVAGAAGALLDAQLWLTRESTLPRGMKDLLDRMDGSETVCLGRELGAMVRVYARPGHTRLDEMRALAISLADRRPSDTAERQEWRSAVRERAGWGPGEIWLVGQDAALARSLSFSFTTTSGVLRGIHDAIGEHVRAAATCRPLDEGSPLAQSHGIRYPVVQGPMTRVSDVPAFAEEVASAGGLPFLAMALMRPAEIVSLLDQTAKLLGDRAWGVGILGFVPPEIREQQMAVIRDRRPPCALIAGGRPDQAQILEKDGIPTYLHVPSPELLKMFLDSGSRRFVFEGRECGGHVGPRSSFVLWEQMIETLLQTIGPNDKADSYHILFAGGIHDSRSSAIVSTLAAPLAARGCRIGVLLGTAYLFTEEAVRAGAVVPGFQQEALRCEGTVLLENGPGHDIRCSRTTYTEFFQREKRRLIGENLSADEIRERLERSTLGRLRIASKGIAHHAKPDEDAVAAPFRKLSEARQQEEGIYMIGQVAALRHDICTIKELHADVSVNGSQWCKRAGDIPAADGSETIEPLKPRPCDLAIVGMACLFPKARNLRQYWENILNKVDAITEVPEHRWNWRRYFDPHPEAPDGICSKWGGFLDETPFDPLRYGLPPSSLASIEPLQLLMLEVVRSAIEDAGYLHRPFSRERTSVILGIGGGLADLANQYAIRSALPAYLGENASQIMNGLPAWTEESFPGILQNVAAGRVANRFDLGGVNFTVDAACASSLAAVHMAAHELGSGNSEMVIVGGADTAQNPLAYLCFSKVGALSPRGKCRTFDDSADGIVLSEGLAAVILKRLVNAERDGDRIYAVIKGVAGSSDGRGKSMTAPRSEGQVLAMQRAYRMAGVSPQSISLIEAHGTGTVAGDQAEVEALKRVMEDGGASQASCAVGSVKSMIGHTKSAAGLAGLIKVAMALHHRVLPPTAEVETPNRKAHFDAGPLYINTEARPWLRRFSEQPRRAGVSSFGFGGTNFHAVLDEYTRNFLPEASAPLEEWPTELFLFSAESEQGLAEKIENVRKALQEGARPACRDLANTLSGLYEGETGKNARLTLAIVASSIDELREMSSQALDGLSRSGLQGIQNPRGIYFSQRPLALEGKLAFLFPGQGSQYPDMLRELAVQFLEVRSRFEFADQILKSSIPAGLSSYIFPPPRFGEEKEQAARRKLRQTDVAQPALGVTEMAVGDLLRSLGVLPEMAAGHSYGEYAALWSAGVLDDDTLLRLSEYRGRFIQEEAGTSPGTMAAVEVGRSAVAGVIEGLKGVWIANVNSPVQTVISGTSPSVNEALRLLMAKGLRAHRLDVACAFHSAIVGAARDRLANELERTDFKVPQFDVFSNTSAAAYPREPAAIAAILADHLVKPVEFAAEVEAMYEAGARIFVEVGPGSVLTGLVGQILEGRPHRAVATDVPGKSGLVQLQHALGQLAAEGVALSPARLFTGRGTRRLSMESLVSDTQERPLPKTVWMVDGGRARPASEPGKLPETVSPRSTAQVAPEIAIAHAHSPTPGNGAPIQGNRAEVILQYQRLMSQFLETQRGVMLAYLQNKNQQPAAAAGSVRPVTTDCAIAPAAVAKAPEPRSALTGVVKIEPVPANGNGWNEEKVTRKLMEIVTDRTGYPLEMLDLNLNLEGDLGINSIKKVEILGAFYRQCPEMEAQLLKGAMDRLTTLKTLRAMVNGLVRALETIPAPPQQPAECEIPRYRRTLVDSQVTTDRTINPPDGTVLITDDGQGVSSLLASGLRRAGARVIVLCSEASSHGIGESIAGDFTSADSIALMIRKARTNAGPIGGLLHLLPLSAPVEVSSVEPAAWRDRLRLEVRSLFLLARELAPDLEPSPGAWFMAASALGGDFGMSSATIFPGQGAIAGFLKSLAKEWPGVRCRVVDCDLSASREVLAEWLMEELADRGPEIEVGRQISRRRCFQTVTAPLREDGPPRVGLSGDSVVLITGGARGITSAVALELARRYRPTLYLAGRSEFPAAEEPARTAGIAAPHELKKALMGEFRARGEAPNAAGIEQACRKLLAEREMRAAVQAMKDAGAVVHYHRADVRDGSSVADLVNRIYQVHGRLDGVIHGAGVIEDELVANKEPASFDRVFDTKVFGALELVRSLRPASLQFLAFFSSVAGMFGNRGQADYGAANEALNKLALALGRALPGRVISINWGPWGDIGMVSPEVGRAFVERGLPLITPEVGQRMFISELTRGSKGEVEVILGDGPWARIPQSVGGKANRSRDLQLPFIENLSLPQDKSGAVDLTYVLSSETHKYLADHQLDSRPVMPAAAALELMAEVVQRTSPELEVVGARDFRVLNGVVLQNGSVPLRIRAWPESGNSTRHVTVLIQGTAEGTRFYQSTIILADRLETREHESPPIQGLGAYPLTVSESYERLLFHGPALQGIEEIHGFGRNGISATLVPSSPSRLMNGATARRWLIDPVVVDSAFQLALLWARLQSNITVLPIRFAVFRRFRPLSGSRVRCEFSAQPADGNQSFESKITFSDEMGQLLWLIEGMEFSGTKQLNRLSGRVMRGHSA